MKMRNYLAALFFTLAMMLGGTLSAAPAGTPESGAASAVADAAALQAIGGSFPKALYNKWFTDYKQKSGVQVTYKPLGSGDGIRAIQEQTVDFAASDAAMSDKQLAAAKGGEILHIPTAFGAIVLSYNLPGFKDKLRLSPETLSAIFLGDIEWWDDERLLADNPALKGRHFPVIVVHRADGSATTSGFTSYLSAVNDTWRNRYGSGTSQYWPRGASAVGNGGVADLIQHNYYAIGYVEHGFAVDKKLPYAAVKNRAGKFIDPDLDSVSAAAATVSGNGTDLRLDVINAGGADAYPIVTGTYVLVYKSQTDAAKANAVVHLLRWALHEGQKANRALNYATVPASLVSKIDAALSTITVSGQPLTEK